jgi:hypothetical protein
MVSAEEVYRSEVSRMLSGLMGRWILIGLSLATSLGAITPWGWQSSAGGARRASVRSFAEDFESAKYYPIYRACRLVHTHTEHSIDRRIGIGENWIQWSLGQFYPPLLRTQNADHILEFGKGDCSERVAVLQSLVRKSRLNTRIVGLGGHVVLEVYANGKWYTADPDYGVVYSGTVDSLKDSSPGYLAMPLIRAGMHRDIVDRYVSLIKSSGDNVVMPLNSPISPRLHWVEEISFFLVITLPCVLWMLCGLLWWNLPGVRAT